MKIGIIELSEKNHHSMIFNWVSIANINGWDITLFTTEEIYENVKAVLIGLNYTVVLEQGSRYSFLKEIKNKYKSSSMDRIIFLSITSSFLQLLFTSFKGINYGITVHNVNAWFHKNSIKKISHFLKRYVRYKLFKNASFTIVNSENMKNYIDNTCKTTKPVYILPFSLKRADTNENAKKETNFTVVYPGSVNVKRKGYDKFIQLAKENINDSFVVLGSCTQDLESKTVFDEMKKIENIKLFNSYISIKEFDEIMLNADLLFSDLVVDFKLSDLNEVYGVTKDSGISYLMIQFNKVSFLNKEFKNLKELTDSTVSFNNFTDLSNQYKKLRNNKEIIKSLEVTITNNCKMFNLNYYANKLKDI